MTDYTPTTEQVRDGYRYDPEDDYYNPTQAGANAERNGRDFDRWLDQTLREAKAEALREAARALEANRTTLFADQIPVSEHWVAQRLGSYGESAWLRDRANKIDPEKETL